MGIAASSSVLDGDFCRVCRSDLAACTKISAVARPPDYREPSAERLGTEDENHIIVSAATAEYIASQTFARSRQAAANEDYGSEPPPPAQAVRSRGQAAYPSSGGTGQTPPSLDPLAAKVTDSILLDPFAPKATLAMRDQPLKKQPWERSSMPTRLPGRATSHPLPPSSNKPASAPPSAPQRKYESGGVHGSNKMEDAGTGGLPVGAQADPTSGRLMEAHVVKAAREIKSSQAPIKATPAPAPLLRPQNHAANGALEGAMAIAGDMFFGPVAPGPRQLTDSKSRTQPPPEQQQQQEQPLVIPDASDRSVSISMPSSTGRSRGSRSSTARLQAELDKREEEHDKQMDALGGRIEQLEAMLLAATQSGAQMQPSLWGGAPFGAQFGGGSVNTLGHPASARGMLTEQLFAEATARAETSGRVAMMPMQMEALLLAARQMQQQSVGASPFILGGQPIPEVDMHGRAQLPTAQAKALAAAVAPVPGGAPQQGGSWERFVDPTTGRIWFWNSATGESLFASSRSHGESSRRSGGGTSRRLTADAESKADSEDIRALAAPAIAEHEPLDVAAIHPVQQDTPPAIHAHSNTGATLAAATPAIPAAKFRAPLASRHSTGKAGCPGNVVAQMNEPLSPPPPPMDSQVSADAARRPESAPPAAKPCIKTPQIEPRAGGTAGMKVSSPLATDLLAKAPPPSHERKGRSLDRSREVIERQSRGR